MIKKLETLAAAVGMAEGGDHQSALELLAELNTALPSGRRRILTVSKDAPLAPEPMEYTLGLASRLHYDTLFLSIISKKSAFRKLAKQHSTGFQAAFKDLSNKLWPGQTPETAHKHAVLLGDFRPLLMEACHRIGGLALVIMQKQRTEPCALNIHVPVFCFDMGTNTATNEVMTPRVGADPKLSGRKS